MTMNVAFRNTLGFVTDGPNTYAELRGFGMGTNYPTVAVWGGNVGWDQILDDISSTNGDATNDPRIAGYTYCYDASRYRIDLPSTGTYPISVAMGRTDAAIPAILEIKDSNTSIGIPINSTTSAAQRFRDITDTEYTQLTWPTNSRYVNFTFATTIARFTVQVPTGAISYISIGDRVPDLVRAVVDYQDVAAVGGQNLLKVTYKVTFAGDIVTPEIAQQRQREIIIEVANDFTVPERRAAIIAAVQSLGTELGLAIATVDILSLGEITPADHVDVEYSPGSFTVLTETYREVGPHLKMTGSQRMTVQGTGRVRGSN